MLLLFVCVTGWADSTPQELAQKLQHKYETLNGFKASFQQSYRSKRFSETMTESGTVYFQKGGQMKWEYERPEKKLFLSDGMFYYYYVAEDKQMVKSPVDNKVDQHSPAMFLAGRGNFVKDFKVDWSDPRPGSHLLKLTPVKPQPDFKFLVVDVDPITGIILQLTVVDEYENRTDYEFHEIQENPKLPPNFFSFIPPPGTDVIFERRDTE